jgi:DNA-binding PadR family transcriptional regulator
LNKTFKNEIVQRITRNLLDIQILRIIQTQPIWGYRIKKQAKALFEVKLRNSTLYPLLNDLERKGFLTSTKQQKTGRTRKVYTLTRKGIRYLEAYYSTLREQIQKSDIK